MRRVCFLLVFLTACNFLSPSPQNEELVRNLEVNGNAYQADCGNGTPARLKVWIENEQGVVESVLISKEIGYEHIAGEIPDDLPSGVHYLVVKVSLMPDYVPNENYGWYENSPGEDVDSVRFVR